MRFQYDDRATWARLALTQSVLEKVAHRLEKAGVQTLAVKGIVTSGWLYETPHTRPLSDLDIRIRPIDFPAANAVVESEGWAIARRNRSYKNLIFDLSGVTVDLECYLGPPGIAAMSVGEMLARASRDARGFWVPDPYDHAVLLTLNVFKDKLKWALPWAVEDVARMVKMPAFDATRYVVRVRETRVAGPAWVVADWMATAHGSVAWQGIRTLLGGDSPERLVYTALTRSLFARDNLSALPARLLLRAGSDDATRWPMAVARTAGWELESRWDASRRGMRQRWYVRPKR